ncbi:hypothetical protein BJY52DRAFT_1252958 [Lactarius psammicola]|nr:hypothetical protein BJY52DRAFT_1252958 [Lactarius psammicola]
MISAARLLSSFFALSWAIASCLCACAAPRYPFFCALLARLRASDISRLLRRACSRSFSAKSRSSTLAGSSERRSDETT